MSDFIRDMPKPVKARKTTWLLVKVTHPADMRASQVRLEVKTALNDYTTYYADQGDVKAATVKARPKTARRNRDMTDVCL